MLLKNLVLIFFVNLTNGNPFTLGDANTGNIPVAEKAATNHPFHAQYAYFQPQSNNTGNTYIALYIAGGNVSLNLNGLPTTTDPNDRPEGSSKQKDTLVTERVTGGNASITFPGNELNDRLTETSTQMETLVTEPENDQSRSNGSDYYIFIHQNVTYKLHTEEKNWMQANNICFKEGGHLVVIESRAEEELLSNMIASKRSLYEGSVWVGVHRLLRRWGVEKIWITVLDKPLEEVGYVNWAPNDPNGDHDCVLFSAPTIANYPCMNPYWFVCEIPQYH